MRKLINRAATPEAVKLYEFLYKMYGTKCITGQMESVGRYPDYEMDYLMEKTGKLPAIRGLDFMANDFDGVAKRAIEWHNKGGIVTICWHTGPDFASEYLHCKEDDLDWTDVFVPGSENYNKLIENMDRAVPALKKIQEAHVPVLWRPFHEFDGGWFWWTRGGNENFLKLWRLMYDRYTIVHHLNNLIWVYGFSERNQDRTDWYPGDEYVDIAGPDSYKNSNNDKLYDEVKAVCPKDMILTLHECGTIPTKEELNHEGRVWSFFMTWHTNFLMTDEYNTVAHVQEIYEDDYFLKLEDVAGKIY